ncbi:MAG: hypothetical protein KME43_17015 [Myxacorys chilensis ATA2-1-KO14]|jgi:hypothetical protein|nr:hypothetical protein [Myxacorys chilensis ATA2-1-KO14]
MNPQSVNLSYEIELQNGEKLTLPDEILDNIGAGRWRVTIAPVETTPPQTDIQNHSAFLSGYAAEDEGLYDDYTAR